MPDFDELFAQLRDVLMRHAALLVVVRDEPGEVQLETMKSGPSGTRMWFGAVQAKKEHVSVQVTALLTHPGLLDDVGDGLRALMQGRTNFNFTPGTATPELVGELSALVDAGLARYRADGLA